MYIYMYIYMYISDQCQSNGHGSKPINMTGGIRIH